MTFTADQIKFLEAPLSRSNVHTRAQAGRKLSYLEGWMVIAEANRIFGFDGWTRETIETRVVSERERAIGADKKPGWGVSYIAKVRIVAGGVLRDGTGAGHGIDVDLGLAHESAIKEAETDATKRALMSFGNPFGLALYDKTQSNVVDEPEGPTFTELLDAQQKVLHQAALKGAQALKEAWIKTPADYKSALKFHLDDVLKPIAATQDDIASAGAA